MTKTEEQAIVRAALEVYAMDLSVGMHQLDASESSRQWASEQLERVRALQVKRGERQ